MKIHKNKNIGLFLEMQPKPNAVNAEFTQSLALYP